ncbi:hypothetical protein [Homoserinibacter gongjuensis]|uniref:Uncharacterized protein n=1 Tax=Homoserinibacter gongjuensis TaxID=1162968 RepID=A0ABQ6JS44_9MICO|nr:hypothetical protein [Homoserinibacter gongjuensis]GMA90065.1 hypothetical protein GCM10025869_05940 [Homoserinibacter gongjuensis]
MRGVYVTAADWNAQSPRERHITLARAVTLMRERRLVLSHRTAAIAWNLPLLGDPPEDVHVIAWRTNGGRSDDRLVRHCLDIPPETVVLDGLEATTLARTVIDVARTSRFAEGVMVADAALARGTRHDDLVAELPEPGHRGVRRAREVVAFADARSGSPVESLSRVSIAEAGLPAPELQHEFSDRDGRMDVDFWWPRFGVIGEFDGKVKYLDERYRNGRTLEQVLLDEKWREQRLRRQPGCDRSPGGMPPPRRRPRAWAACCASTASADRDRGIHRPTVASADRPWHPQTASATEIRERYP